MRVNKSACGCLSTCPQQPPESGIDDNDIDIIHLVHSDIDDIDTDIDTDIYANEMVCFYGGMSTGRRRTDSQVYAMHCTCLACCLNCHLHYRKSDRQTHRPARSVYLFAQHLTATDKQTHAGVSLIFQSATDR